MTHDPRTEAGSVHVTPVSVFKPLHICAHACSSTVRQGVLEVAGHTVPDEWRKGRPYLPPPWLSPLQVVPGTVLTGVGLCRLALCFVALSFQASYRWTTELGVRAVQNGL